jgi:hypothetical protein
MSSSLRIMTVLRNFSLSNDFIEGIVFHPGNKVDALGCPLAKQGIVIISSVIDYDGPRSKMELRHDFHISHLAFRDDGKGGQIPIMIQKQVQFDCSFGSAKLRPVKQGDREINDRRVQPHQFVLESELSLPLNLVLTSFEQLEKDPLVELPGAVLIGIRQGGAIGGGDAKMFQFSLAAS